MKETPFVQLYEGRQLCLEYHGAETETQGKHQIILFKVEGSDLMQPSELTEIEQIWLTDRQIKQLYFALGESLTRNVT